MALLAEKFGHKPSPMRYKPSTSWVLPFCRVGLEWEFENAAVLMEYFRRAPTPFLETKNDGSLRDGGVEFVTTGAGLFGEDLVGAIDAMADLVKKGKPINSYRCAFHVHVDVRDMDALEVHNMLVLYCLLEQPIFAFVGDDRSNSNFCVPWYRADSMLPLFKQIVNPGDEVLMRIKRLQRYSALNVAALAKLGTVEYRHMFNRPEEIKTKQISFINLTLAIKKLAADLFIRGITGEALYLWAKSCTPDQLINKLGVPLPTIGWDYIEALTLAGQMVEFQTPKNQVFREAQFKKFFGQHPNWR